MKYRILDEETLGQMVDFLDTIQIEASKGKFKDDMDKINMCSYLISEIINSSEATDVDTEEDIEDIKKGDGLYVDMPDIQVESDYIYQAGDKIEAVYPTNSSVSTRYLVIDATGAVSGTVGSDPGYVSVGPDTSQTLTFPATFDTGNAPDDELAAGTTIKVSAQATNSEGSSEFGPSNIVTPS